MASGIDLEQLSPAPWRGVRRFDVESGRDTGDFALAHKLDMLALFTKEVDVDFAALARNAFDVQMRRGWTANCNGEIWWVDADDKGSGGVDEHDYHPGPFAKWLDGMEWPDPFTALVEADHWYRENVESQDARRHEEVPRTGSGSASKPSSRR